MSSREQRVIGPVTYEVIGGIKHAWLDSCVGLIRVPMYEPFAPHISRPGATSGTTAGGQPVADPPGMPAPGTPKTRGSSARVGTFPLEKSQSRVECQIAQD